MKIITEILLPPFAVIYSLIIALRNFFYDRGAFKSVKLPVPVIAVGNITAGGTGKTPFVISLASQLSQKGIKVGIISRGYKRKGRGLTIVSDGQSVLVNSRKSGEEPFLIARKLPQCVVVVHKSRVKAGKAAINKFGCDLLIMDDGFQHRKLKRDINLVLWDGYKHPKDENLLPVGRMRETFACLKRIHTLILTRKTDPSIIDYFHEIRPELPVLSVPTVIESVRQIKPEKQVQIDEIEGKKVMAICGLGNPKQFFDTVQQLNPAKMEAMTFPDHFKYDRKSIRKILTLSEDMDWIVTTEKDAANWPSDKIPKQLAALEIHMKIGPELINKIISELKL